MLNFLQPVDSCVSEGSEPIEELGFTETTYYDGSDLPIDIVAQHLAAGSCHVSVGFDVEEDGSLCRSAAVEDTEFDEDYGDEVVIEAPVFGRGHRTKHETRPFGGLEAWEEH